MKRTGLLVLALATLTTAAGAAAELQPLTVGAERHFALTWQPVVQNGRPVVEGTVENVSPYEVTAIRILVESLDAAGTITAQRVAWVPGQLRGNGRLFFQVPAAPAPAYRVRIFSYDRIETDGNFR
jgi:hypothetical protein